MLPQKISCQRSRIHDSENHACFGEDGIMLRQKATILIVKGRRKQENSPTSGVSKRHNKLHILPRGPPNDVV